MYNDLIGNDRVKMMLRRLLENGRISNAFLFAGPEGVGKKRFALRLAAGFVCRQPATFEPCGECSACRRAAVFEFPQAEKKDDFKRVIFSEHPDIGMVVPYNRNVLVDAVRDLEREANFHPYEANARFFIIDDADKMNDAASNALLKTLEEPPATSHIILVTSRPDSLLPTILSRCQTIRFAPLTPQEIEAHLIVSGRFAAEDARIAARLAAGSLGRASSIGPEELRDRRKRMVEVLENTLKAVDRAALLSISESLADAKNKDGFETDMAILETLIHDVWTLKLTGEPEKLVHADLAGRLAEFARNARTEALAAWMREIELLRERAEVNINKRIAADALLMEMAAGNAGR
jgi:DNA polymerase-3 subunit delta'